MKTKRLFFPVGALCLGVIFLGGEVGRVAAQTSTNGASVPTVTLRATDPYASWQGDTGTFTFFRDGPTNATLNVFYRIDGTASNGVDYATIGNFVTIAAGARTNSVIIKPINNGQTQTETVVLTMAPSPMLNPVNYIIGNPSNAVVFIRGGTSTNMPPVVRITSPPNGAIFHGPVDIPIYAYAHDFDGYVSSVEFFAGSNSLGFGHSVIAASATATDLFAIVWSNAPPGNYALTAEATDNGGASSVSSPVNISILPSPPPPTNRPPILTIVATDPVAIEGTNCWPWRGVTNPTPAWSNWTAATPYRYFTNCGPKNAIFTVHRYGATNDPITANYQIGGTATNGVDYMTLPGVVTIPAGERNALITVVPLDDGPPDITSTVILTLQPSTNSPADYLLGLPRRAGAIIVDGAFPRPVSGTLADRCFHVAASGPDGAWFRIEFATNLLNWIPVCTNQVVQGSIEFVDPDAPDDAVRFYRAVPQSTGPQE